MLSTHTSRTMKLYWYHFVLRLQVTYFVLRPEISYRNPEILCRIFRIATRNFASQAQNFVSRISCCTLKFCISHLTCFMFYGTLGLGNIFYVVPRGTEAQLSTWKGVLMLFVELCARQCNIKVFRLIFKQSNRVCFIVY